LTRTDIHRHHSNVFSTYNASVESQISPSPTLPQKLCIELRWLTCLGRSKTEKERNKMRDGSDKSDTETSGIYVSSQPYLMFRNISYDNMILHTKETRRNRISSPLTMQRGREKMSKRDKSDDGALEILLVLLFDISNPIP
jgi:hypothetical protein